MNALTPETLARAEAEDAAALEPDRALGVRRAKRYLARKEHEAEERAALVRRLVIFTVAGAMCLIAAAIFAARVF